MEEKEYTLIRVTKDTRRDINLLATELGVKTQQVVEMLLKHYKDSK